MTRCVVFLLASWFATTALAKEDAAADASAADLARMQGDWMIATMKADGAEVPAEESQALFRTIEGDKFTVSRYSKVINRGTLAIDATKSPKTIDIIPEALAPPGAAAGAARPPQKSLGIYEFDGPKIRICLARPGAPRPKNFEARQYTGHTLIVWEPEVK